MSRLYTLLIFAAVTLCFDDKQVFAQDTEQWNGSCDIVFLGKSTLHNFAGSVKAEPFTATISNPGDPSKAGISGRVTVKAAKMDTDNKKRDVNMREAMEVSTYPVIVADVANWKIVDTKPVAEGRAPHPTIIPFTLKIKGGKQKIVGTVTDWSSTGSVISCIISFPVSLKTSGIVVPSVLGLIKVADQIQVEAKLILKKS